MREVTLYLDETTSLCVPVKQSSFRRALQLTNSPGVDCAVSPYDNLFVHDLDKHIDYGVSFDVLKLELCNFFNFLREKLKVKHFLIFCFDTLSHDLIFNIMKNCSNDIYFVNLKQYLPLPLNRQCVTNYFQRCSYHLTCRKKADVCSLSLVVESLKNCADEIEKMKCEFCEFLLQNLNAICDIKHKRKDAFDGIKIVSKGRIDWKNFIVTLNNFNKL